MSQSPRRELVAHAVRTELQRRGMTTGRLAELSGILADHLDQRLSGAVAFDVDELEAVGVALGVSIVSLLGLDRIAE